ncbi:MAG TPA: hypothetical protein IAC14_08045 [Candidatus Scybalomonas excrementigallinarum]|nr:hypothetical protein [Candidatus Scybalomonas excrementigallinarum]
MILYITSFRNSEIIGEAVEKSSQTIMDTIVNDRESLVELVKTKLSQLQSPSHLLIDIQALTDTDDEILQAIRSLRMVYDDKKLIIVALEREKGDEFLSQLFAMGIYDLVTKEDSEPVEEIMYCIDTGKKFKDSMQYQKEKEIEQTKEKEKVKVTEKVIIQNHIITKVSNALIGITGTISKVGTTHHTILTANYLKTKGYHIAVLECSEKPVLNSYMGFFEAIEHDEGYFEYEKVHYYPQFEMNKMSLIYTKGYDIILIDFGVLRNDIFDDFLRCMIQVVLSGSQPYELGDTDDIFELDKAIFKNFKFVFRDVDEKWKEIIKSGMEELDVYFAPLVRNPFAITDNEEIKKLYKEFAENKNKDKKGWLYDFFSKAKKKK